MYVTVTNYRFKGPEEKAKGIDYLQTVYIPNQASHFGFISHVMAGGKGDEVFLMLRYRVKENRFGKAVDPEGFKAFLELLAGRPATVAGPNRADLDYHGIDYNSLRNKEAAAS